MNSHLDPNDRDPLAGPRTRQVLIEAAAKAISSLPGDVLLGIASSDTARFVQSSRQTYKTAGFNFTDADLREIHELVRGYASIHLQWMASRETVQ